MRALAAIINILGCVDFLNYWRLRERPFEATWDTRFFYSSRDHEEALQRLLYLVGEHSMNIGMLSGEIGCGKTLTRSVFARRLDPERHHVVTLENSGFPFNDLLGAMLRRLEAPGQGTGQSKFARCERFEKALHRVRSEGRHMVMLLDEAQDIPSSALRELRWLTNFNGGGHAYLTMVLIGQPELRQVVAANPAINQRISLRFHLRPLSAADVAGYLRHRLMAAGHAGGELFSDESVQLLHESTKGVPRELNRLAKLALEHAWLREVPRVELESVRAVVHDLERHQALPVT
jgi:general secretion pathway protein A